MRIRTSKSEIMALNWKSVELLPQVEVLVCCIEKRAGRESYWLKFYILLSPIAKSFR